MDDSHPYYPLGVRLPTYVANTMGARALVSVFAAGCGAMLLATWAFASAKGKRKGGRGREPLSGSEVVVLFWWVLCGFIHLFFEGCIVLTQTWTGYFALHHADMPSRRDLFGQLWKEYALSDSRYMTRDPFVVCMETVTALLWGPLSFALAHGVAARRPWRHPLQLVVCVGQLYGDVLYYAICWFEELANGVVYSRPERYYYWGYFVLCNAFWIVIPLALVAQSVRAVGGAMREAGRGEEGEMATKKGEKKRQ
ncbi:hypothetical protein E4U41_004295 [Claviceps citrina]|nr:hypothetical protein E4U41_004295 [Claviceps citrina]